MEAVEEPREQDDWTRPDGPPTGVEKRAETPAATQMISVLDGSVEIAQEKAVPAEEEEDALAQKEGRCATRAATAVEEEGVEV